MRRFYLSFLTLLLTASAALTALLSMGARMRGGAAGPLEIITAAVSFVALTGACLLLLRILLALSPARSMMDEGEER